MITINWTLNIITLLFKEHTKRLQSVSKECEILSMKLQKIYVWASIFACWGGPGEALGTMLGGDLKNDQTTTFLDPLFKPYLWQVLYFVGDIVGNVF